MASPVPRAEIVAALRAGVAPTPQFVSMEMADWRAARAIIECSWLTLSDFEHLRDAWCVTGEPYACALLGMPDVVRRVADAVLACPHLELTEEARAAVTAARGDAQRLLELMRSPAVGGVIQAASWYRRMTYLLQAAEPN